MSRLTRLWRHLVDPEAASARDVPPLHRPGFPVAVCWSAKAGCTTVLKWFLHHTGLLDAALARDPWPHHYRSHVLMHPVADYVAACMKALRGRDLEVVKVVRDPARRAVSSYLHLVRRSPDTPWKHGVGEWKRRVGLGRQAGLAFEQFLHFVIDTRTAGRAIDMHFQPQFQPKWDAFVDRVIPLESLADGLATLEERHGLPRTDVRTFSDSAHHNPPDHRHGWPRDAARFPATDVDVRRFGIPPVEAFLDGRTVELVRIAYARDYEAYGSLYAERPRQSLRRAA